MSKLHLTAGCPAVVLTPGGRPRQMTAPSAAAGQVEAIVIGQYVAGRSLR
jgi:hypothetical protein